MCIGDLGDIQKIVPYIVVIAIVLAAIFYLWGLNSGSKVTIGDLSSHDCNERISSLSQDYGYAITQDSFFLDGNDVYLVNFNSSWLVPFNGKDCRIIEDGNLSKSTFQTAYFKRQLTGIPDDFFTSTRDCINIAGAKGANNACQLTGIANQILDFPVTQIAVKLPTQDTESMANALGGKGWAKVTAQGVKLIKHVDNYAVLIEIADDASCTLGNSPKKAIWDLADNGNQIITNAKADRFTTDTIPKLIASSELISSFEGLSPVLKLPDREAPKDVLGIFGFLIQLVIDIISFFVKLFVQVTLDTMTIVAEPQCSADAQVAKFQAFENILRSDTFVTDYNAFDVKLGTYKENATQAMQVEQTARASNGPSSITQFLLLDKVVHYYVFEGSQSQQFFNDQLFVSAEKAANLKAEYYADYWKNVNIFDWIFSASLWIIIGVVAVLGGLYAYGKLSQPPMSRGY